MSNTEALRAAAADALRIFDWLARRSIYTDTDMATVHANLRAALAQQPAASGEPATLQLWCDTCEGTGKVHQEHQRGVIGSGGTFDCPDCDGNGFVKTSRYVLAATAKPAPALVPLTDAEIDAIRGRAECWEHVGQRIEFRHRPFARAVLAAAATPAQGEPK